jgi:TPR repeat protein
VLLKLWPLVLVALSTAAPFEARAADATADVHVPSWEHPLLSGSVPPGIANDTVAARVNVNMFREMAKQGDASGQYNLGIAYSTGIGVPKDERTAVAWFRRAAEQGDMLAQYDLATMYANGRGVPRSYRNAAQWYLRSARQGHFAAVISIGVMYAKGEGVPQDSVEALKWLRVAELQRFKVREVTDPLRRSMTEQQVVDADRRAEATLKEVRQRR